MQFFDETWSRATLALSEQGRLRRLRRLDSPGLRVTLDGKQALRDFSSNDYLGLSQHPRLIDRACAFAEEWGAGSAASRLVRGNLAPFEAIEAKLAAGKGTEAALVLASGFQCNASVLPALLDAKLLGAEPQVFADRLNHASLHMGLQAAGVRQKRFQHNDLTHLARLLAEAPPGPKFVFTESVFSMDGDRADIPALVELCEAHGAFLYVDEAHATGVLGDKGWGLTEGLAARIGIVMGTFSKALGGFGAYVCCSGALRSYLVNRCAGAIYSTALPPAVLGAMDAALDLIPELGPERARVAAHAARLRAALAELGVSDAGSTTQIVPAVIGSEDKTLAVSRRLEELGILGIAIRPPTVPAGTARIRFALSAGHTDEDVAALIEALREVLG